MRRRAPLRRVLDSDRPPGLVACRAMPSLAARQENRRDSSGELGMPSDVAGIGQLVVLASAEEGFVVTVPHADAGAVECLAQELESCLPLDVLVGVSWQGGDHPLVLAFPF